MMLWFECYYLWDFIACLPSCFQMPYHIYVKVLILAWIYVSCFWLPYCFSVLDAGAHCVLYWTLVCTTSYASACLQLLQCLNVAFIWDAYLIHACVVLFGLYSNCLQAWKVLYHGCLLVHGCMLLYFLIHASWMFCLRILVWSRWACLGLAHF